MFTRRQFKNFYRKQNKTVEEQAVYWITYGTASKFARAIALLRRGYNRKKLVWLGQHVHYFGRVMKTIAVVDKIVSGEYDSAQRRRAIQILAGSAGRAVP